MRLMIDIPEEQYRTLNARTQEDVVAVIDVGLLERAIKSGTPLNILDDGTLTVTIEDYTKVKRVLVQDENNCGGLFYADCN